MRRVRRVPLRAFLGLLGLGLAASAYPALAGAPHPTVLWQKHDAAAVDAVKPHRQRWAEHRARWPRFLTDTRRNASLRARGLLTGESARAARAAKPAGTTETVRVLLTRVGFATNREPGLTSMLPSGDFMLEPDSTIIIDPPPHDARYFEAQFVAMKAYYDAMSYGTLDVQGTVFPPQDEPSVKMSDPADYGPGAGGRWTIELLERWFRDAIATLDSAATLAALDLSQFDAFVLVHPGSDLQNDIDRNSPNDLPTFFISLADSILVQGSLELRSGLVFPETLTQDGLTGGILGGLCHEFGHQLGLPDWYDTRFGLPVVGEWDLMDSGNAAFFAFQVEGSDDVHVAYGLLPTAMSAVDRWLLGWDEPYVVRAPQDVVTLRPTNSTQGIGPRAARLDIAADESFIVENRRDYLYERPEDVAICPYLNRDADTGVILWMSRDDEAVPSRDRRNSNDYDFFISSPTAPTSALGECGELGFGLIVWHFDERVFAEGYGFNEVNASERQRALRILEASGDFEIGDWRMPTVSFLGDGYNDPYRQGFKTQLDATTVPNNWNNDWAETGWEITSIEEAPPESHTLTVRVREGVAGWPQILRSGADSLQLEAASAVWTRLGSGAWALVLADSSGLFGFTALGPPQRLVDGAVLPASLAQTDRLAPGDSVPTVAALDLGSLWMWDATAAGLVVRAGFPAAIPGGSGPRLVLLEAATGAPGALVETPTGAWVRIDAAGAVAQTYDVDSAAREADPVVGPFGAGGAWELALVSRNEVAFGPLPGGGGRTFAHGLDAPDSLLLTAGGQIEPGSAQVVVLHRDGRLRVVDAARGLLPEYADLPRDRYLGLALGDLNGDGELDIVAASATRVAAVTSRGARLLNTPIPLQDTYALKGRVRIVAGPCVADIAGDALPEILLATDLGLVYVLDADGRRVSGYPRKLLPDLFPATLLVAEADGDPVSPEILAVSSVATGVVSPAGGSNRPGWTAWGGNTARTRFAVAPAPVAESARLVALERPLLAYPNPSRDGTVQLRITAQQEGDYDLRIYNLEGEQVFERRGRVRAGTQEIAWRYGGLATGLYFCRFVSPAAGVPAPLVEPISILR